jgi:hypothetical protein
MDLHFKKLGWSDPTIRWTDDLQTVRQATMMSLIQHNSPNFSMYLLISWLSLLTCISSNNALWTPIEVNAKDDATDPTIVTCDLLVGFQQYAAAPHDHPKFRDVVTASKCNERNQRKEKLSVLLKEAPQALVTPTAFVFHESRVGSTLVSNMLAANPRSLVFSESKPPVDALFHCPKCHTDQERGELFRSVLHLMGSSVPHDHLFFKFQSIVSQKMSVVLSVFPDVPWVFIYRAPVQTLMSHLDPSKGGNNKPPCLKSKKRPTEQVRQCGTGCAGGTVRADAYLPLISCSSLTLLPPTPLLSSSQTSPLDLPSPPPQVEMSEALDAPREAWCAWHLNTLCQHALRAYDAFSLYNTSSTSSTASVGGTSTLLPIELNRQQPQQQPQQRRRGFFVNYASLPGAVSAQLLPAFGVPAAQLTADWRARMDLVSRQYSKARGGEGKGKKKGKGAVEDEGKGKGKDGSEGEGEGKGAGGTGGAGSQQLFVSDSQDKEERASPMLKRFADMIMQPTYKDMEKVSERCWRQWREERAARTVVVG